jgi:hypothetical protein
VDEDKPLQRETNDNPGSIISDKGKSEVASEKSKIAEEKAVEDKALHLTSIPLKKENSLKVTHAASFELHPNRKHCRIGGEEITLYHPDEAFIGGRKTGRKLNLAQFDAIKVQKVAGAEAEAAIYISSAYNHPLRTSTVYYYDLGENRVNSILLKQVANLSEEEAVQLWKERKQPEVLAAAHNAHEHWLQLVKVISAGAPKRIIFKHELPTKRPAKRNRIEAEASEADEDEEESQDKEIRHHERRQKPMKKVHEGAQDIQSKLDQFAAVSEKAAHSKFIA